MSLGIWWGDWLMGRTESIFAGVLLAAVIAAVALVLMSNGGSSTSSSSSASYAENDSKIGTFGARFTGTTNKDLCTCYEQAFAFGAKYEDISSDIYRSGFQSCAARLGADGGKAWTTGWRNGMTGARSRSKCRGFIAEIRSLEAQ